MKSTKLIMGMPITIEIVDRKATKQDLNEVFAYFLSIDKQFSPFKKFSEVSLINKGKLAPINYSPQMQEVLELSAQTKKETNGFFDVYHENTFNPSGLVKGWAINNAAKILSVKGFQNFYINAGGDIQTKGLNIDNKPWLIGIRNPFQKTNLVKVVSLTNTAIATSGTYERGYHIYNPKSSYHKPHELVCLSVIGPDIYEADRFATAAFVMGHLALNFIASKPGLSGFAIDKHGNTSYTTNFLNYCRA
jgi:thiamine biosynthesis lipoprotein